MHKKAALCRTALIWSFWIAAAYRVYCGGILHAAHMYTVEVTAEIACAKSIHAVVVREFGIAVTVRTAEFISLYLSPAAAAAPALQDKLYLLWIAVGVFNVEVAVFPEVCRIKCAAVLSSRDRYGLTPCTCRVLSPEKRYIRVALA